MVELYLHFNSNLEVLYYQNFNPVLNFLSFVGGRVQQHQQPPARAEPAFHPAPVEDRHRFQAEDPPRRAPGRLNQLDVGRFHQEDQHGHHGMMNGGRRAEDRVRNVRLSSIQRLFMVINKRCKYQTLDYYFVILEA